MSDDDHADLEWIRAQREQVLAYVARNVDHYNEVGQIPAFQLSPYLSIWAIESKAYPGWVGFWCFSGNLPTDVIKRDWKDNYDNPRKALSRMIVNWKAYILHLKEGNNPPGVTMGNSSDQRREMAELLDRRVGIFSGWVADSQYWDDEL